MYIRNHDVAYGHGAISEYERPGLLHTYHIEDGSRFLYPESLHHLKDVHHSLCLAALNGGCYGTEHPRVTHCVTTTGNAKIVWNVIVDTIFSLATL